MMMMMMMTTMTMMTMMMMMMMAMTMIMIMMMMVMMMMMMVRSWWWWWWWWWWRQWWWWWRWWWWWSHIHLHIESPPARHFKNTQLFSNFGAEQRQGCTVLVLLFTIHLPFQNMQNRCWGRFLLHEWRLRRWLTELGPSQGQKQQGAIPLRSWD